MFEFDFYNYVESTERTRIDDLTRRIEDLFVRDQYRQALSLIIQEVPYRLSMIFDDGYYKNSCFYTLGMLLAAVGEDRAVEYIQKSGVLSAGDWSSLMFSDHMRLADQNLARQVQAVRRHIPLIYMASLPKSASAFVSNTVSRALDIPVLRSSIGDFPRARIVPNWLLQVAQGGCTTHEHFDARPENLQQLRRNGIAHLFVQVRDPRECIWSLLHHTRSMYPENVDRINAHTYIHTYYPAVVGWIDSWVRSQEASATTGSLRLSFLFYRNVKSNPRDVIVEVIEKSGLSKHRGAVLAYFDRIQSENRKPDNYRSGDSAEWRRNLPDELKQELWNSTPSTVKNLLRMEE